MQKSSTSTWKTTTIQKLEGLNLLQSFKTNDAKNLTVNKKFKRKIIATKYRAKKIRWEINNDGYRKW